MTLERLANAVVLMLAAVGLGTVLVWVRLWLSKAPRQNGVGSVSEQWVADQRKH